MSWGIEIRRLIKPLLLCSWRWRCAGPQRPPLSTAPECPFWSEMCFDLCSWPDVPLKHLLSVLGLLRSHRVTLIQGRISAVLNLKQTHWLVGFTPATLTPMTFGALSAFASDVCLSFVIPWSGEPCIFGVVFNMHLGLTGGITFLVGQPWVTLVCVSELIATNQWATGCPCFLRSWKWLLHQPACWKLSLGISDSYDPLHERFAINIDGATIIKTLLGGVFWQNIKMMPLTIVS